MEEDLQSFSTKRDDEGEGQEDENVLKFLDSLDDYLTLMDSLSSTLRQGWLDLASARHSMGSSRISSALFDLKVKSAPTKFQMTEHVDGSELVSQPHYTLSKWASSQEVKDSSSEVEGALRNKYNSSQLKRRLHSHLPEEVQEIDTTTKVSPIVVNNNVQRERSKSLSVFGTLVPPKLRAAQVSFETVLEMIVEVANKRSSMLSAFSLLQQEKEGSD